MSGDGGARFVAVLIVIAAAVAVFERGALVRMTADAKTDDVALWVWASDAAPGDIFEARVRSDGGERAAIRRVTIRINGYRQVIRGPGVTWGEEIEARKYTSDSSTFDFKFTIPSTMKPGDTVTPTFEIDSVRASRFANGFTNDDDETTLVGPPIQLTSPTMSIARRAGRGALAIASCLVVVFGFTFLRDRYGRRHTPSEWWWALALPYFALGYFWFYAQVSAATRLHGWWLLLACVAVWTFAFVVFARRIRYRYLPIYTVHPAVEAPNDEPVPYRSNDAPPALAKPVFELEAAWSGDGVICKRRGATLELRTSTGVAILPVPASGMFGTEPFELHCHDRNQAINLLETAGKVLGPLRCHELRDEPFPFVRVP